MKEYHKKKCVTTEFLLIVKRTLQGAENLLIIIVYV